MRTISDIIKAAGGARAIELATGGAISKDAVYKWPTIGIVDRHWPILIERAGTTPEELYMANKLVRSDPGGPMHSNDDAG